MPLVSVIVPVYNGALTIKETIESVLCQSFSDFEILVINDGSQDATLDVLATISDPRLSVFSYPNAGVSISRNRGIAKASGELLAFLDADDCWTSDKLEAQVQALQESPEAAVAYSWTDYINEDGAFLYPGSHIAASGMVYDDLLLKNFIENGSNPLVRRSALLAVGEFDASLPPAEDWDMWLRLAHQFPFVAVPRSQILYRISTQSGSTNLNKMEAQSRRVLEQAFARSPDMLPELKRRSLSNLYQYLMFRALEGAVSRCRSLTAGRYLFQSIRYDTALIMRRKRLMAIVCLKVLLQILLTPQQTERITQWLKA